MWLGRVTLSSSQTKINVIKAQPLCILHPETE